ncbi:phage tail protein [Humibacter ginsenosidimutans]|uniref:Phage tail protein n=1 Tax=Humibacter ginsenosidimutans TaxID=2599293 RepID=A0A5B8M6B8_9MICO|nr:tail fiber protein [Humibacter ginsenosidimutans]QDZ15315.1 phage tail protein [Humibacter ginsenosidimutans]
MSEAYLGEIRVVSFTFAPKGWAFCNGQLLAINQNQALFSLLGTTYGGDGRANFALPDLRARMPIAYGGTGAGANLGAVGGEAAHTLTVTELPAHTHVPSAGPSANQTSPAGGFWGTTSAAAYAATTPNSAMSPTAVSQVGGSQAHENQSPYLGLNFVIALQGIFPSRT